MTQVSIGAAAIAARFGPVDNGYIFEAGRRRVVRELNSKLVFHGVKRLKAQARKHAVVANVLHGDDFAAAAEHVETHVVEAVWSMKIVDSIVVNVDAAIRGPGELERIAL